MVTKSKKAGAKKGRVQVDGIKLNKETIKDLTDSDQKRVKGGVGATDEIRPTHRLSRQGPFFACCG